MNLQNTNPGIQGVDNAFLQYRAILNQAGTATPTATVLRNTFGGIAPVPTIGRTSAGLYTLTWTNPVLVGNVFTSTEIEKGSTAVMADAVKTSTTVLTIGTWSIARAAVDLVGNLFLRIEVYPT